jgi:hypothetical protein
MLSDGSITTSERVQSHTAFRFVDEVYQSKLSIPRILLKSGASFFAVIAKQARLLSHTFFCEHVRWLT